MSDKQNQASIDGVLELEGKKYIPIDDFEKLKADVESVKSINVGNEKKKAELSNAIKERDAKIDELSKLFEEKQKEKMSAEEKRDQEVRELKEMIMKSSKEVEKAKKESFIKDVMAEFGLKSKADFALLIMANDNDEIKSLAKEQAEFYEKIKSETLKSIADGSVPKKGGTQMLDKLEGKTVFELGEMLVKNPDMTYEQREPILKQIEKVSIAQQ